MRWRRSGDTSGTRSMQGATDLERFEHWIERGVNCWTWKGALDRRGYGRMKFSEGGSTMAHRWAYEHFVGPIPEGLVLDHLCRNPACVRPDHLEPVTNYENVVSRGVTSVSAVNARKTHCKYGHALTPDNTYDYGYGRACKECQKRRSAEYRARKVLT